MTDACDTPAAASPSTYTARNGCSSLLAAAIALGDSPHPRAAQAHVTCRRQGVAALICAAVRVRRTRVDAALALCHHGCQHAAAAALLHSHTLLRAHHVECQRQRRARGRRFRNTARWVILHTHTLRCLTFASKRCRSVCTTASSNCSAGRVTAGRGAGARGLKGFGA